MGGAAMTELRIGCMTAATEVNGTIRVDRYRSYRYRDDPELMWRRNGLPPGLEKKYRRDGSLPRGWEKRRWRDW